MGAYRNPILPGCHPDPSICRVGDTFFLVTSTFEYLPGLPIHVSRNLVDWELVGHAIERPEQLDLSGIPSSKGLYAPTIRYHDGRFHVVCTVVGPWKPGDEPWPGRTGHFLVTAEDVRGPWSEPIWFDSLPGIDPSLTFDAGRVWLCGNRLAEPGLWHGQTDIWLRELDPETFAVIGDEHLIWRGALEGAGWAEGPHILTRPGGGYLLVAAEGGTDRDHAVCVAYADDITGPYVGDPGNPRLTHRDLGDRALIANVGHADLVEDADGRTWATMLATHTDGHGRNGLLGRQTHLVPVAWEDGRPLFAPGTGRVEADMEAEGVPDQSPWPTEYVDDFTHSGLDAGWNGVARFPREFAQPMTSGGLRLDAGADPWTLGPQSCLLRRLTAEHAIVEASVRVPSGDVRVGAVLRTAETALVAVEVDPAGAVRVILVDGTPSVVGGTVVGPEGTAVLSLAVSGRMATVRVDGEVVCDLPLDALATGRPSMFVGTWAGVFASGSGQADVHAFRLTTDVPPAPADPNPERFS